TVVALEAAPKSSVELALSVTGAGVGPVVKSCGNPPVASLPPSKTIPEVVLIALATLSANVPWCKIVVPVYVLAAAKLTVPSPVLKTDPGEVPSAKTPVNQTAPPAAAVSATGAFSVTLPE